MHILLLASYYPTHANRIVGTFIEKQAVALHKAGHTVGVIVLPRLSATREQARSGGLRAVTRERYLAHAESIPVYRMHWGWFPRPLPPIAAPLAESAGLAAYAAYVRAHGAPDALYAHDIFYGGVLAAAIKRRHGVRAALLEHSSAYLEGRVIFPGQAQLIRRTLRTVDAPFTVGVALVNALHQYAPEVTVPVLGNVVDTDFFTPGVPPIAPPFQFTVIAGMKERRKAFDVLIAAFAAACGGRDQVRLCIRGDGPLKPEVEADIAARGLRGQVDFLPRQSPEGLRDLIRASHVVVCASTIETFNVSIAEAMACGVPVLSTRCGGPEDYITRDTGILVPPGDANALADGMRRMIDEYHRFDRAAARAIIMEKFSEPAIAARLVSALTQRG